MRRLSKSGFTLIELLTVMAISVVLLTIIVVPVFQTFNFTRSAQAFSDAQDRARIVADRIAREIGNAASVRNTQNVVATTLNGNPASVLANSLIVKVPKIGSQSNPNPTLIEVVLPYVKLDIVKPAEGDYSQSPGQYKNPNNGFIDPTLLAPRGQPVLPVAPGSTVVRYFVGLRDPFNAYNNPYDGILMGRSGSRDNLFVLYRVEFQPYIYRAGTGSNGDISSRWRPNPTYFLSDPVTDTVITNFDDPRFFLWDNAYPNKKTIIQNWQTHAVIQTEINRYDMIQPVYDKFSHQVTYSGDAPLIVPLIQFRPSHMSNDPAMGQVASRQGEETNNGAAIGPDVYRTQYGLWTNQIARVWPQGWAPAGSASGFNQYFVGRNDPSNGKSGAPPGYSVYFYDPSVSQTDYNSGQECFDIFTYDYVSANSGLYPFTQAINAANNRSLWLENQNIRNLFVPFDMNTAKGALVTSFNISEVGDPSQSPPASNPQNLPSVLSSPDALSVYSPIQDPNRVLAGSTYVINGNFYDPAFQTINELFNWVAINAPNITPERHIDLRVTPNGDGTASPLSPVSGFAKCTIVPGSEVVYGPDQLPGPNQGNTVRYVRTTHNPGPNQYSINYTDQPEPADYALLGLSPSQLAGFKPGVYDGTNFCSALIQPRFKKGYIKLNSDPNYPIPFGQFQVSYRFQFNGSGANVPAGVNASDVFAVDYDTRQLISVQLTIRNYPQTTNIPNPQTATVKATASVRNVIR